MLSIVLLFFWNCVCMLVFFSPSLSAYKNKMPLELTWFHRNRDVLSYLLASFLYTRLLLLYGQNVANQIKTTGQSHRTVVYPVTAILHRAIHFGFGRIFVRLRKNNNMGIIVVSVS